MGMMHKPVVQKYKSRFGFIFKSCKRCKFFREKTCIETYVKINYLRFKITAILLKSQVLIFLVIFACSCGSRNHNIVNKSYGGAWTGKETPYTPEETPPAISDTMANSGNEIPLTFVKENRNQDKVLKKLKSQRKCYPKSKEVHSKVNRTQDEQSYKDAKTSMFTAMAGGVIYALGFTILDPPVIGLLMWLPALNSVLLTLIALAVCILLIISLFYAKDALEGMNASDDRKGKQFAILATFASLGMLVSMAPLVIYFAILAVIFILTN